MRPVSEFPPRAERRGRPLSLSAVLPAYNEQAVISETLRRTHAALAATGIPRFEVIVVDDGSADATRERCDEVAAQLPEVRVVSHARNRGYGGALRSGFESASGDALFVMDSDGQFDPADIELLLPEWDGATVVCGRRVKRVDPLIRRLNHDAFFGVVNLLFGRTARDINCGFKLFPRAAGQGLTTDGAVICTELLVRARAGGLRIVDVPVPHHPRLTGKPTGARIGVIAHAFRELWRLRREVRRAGPSAPASLDGDEVVEAPRGTPQAGATKTR